MVSTTLRRHRHSPLSEARKAPGAPSSLRANRLHDSQARTVAGAQRTPTPSWAITHMRYLPRQTPGTSGSGGESRWQRRLRHS